ncbi:MULTISPECIES: hypothetical protein [unclassified Caulobacter]|uniref:hypothetical protein n=1 Tax=unclassified Caulobacter TaxID=2648921 RepID=UPI000D36EDD7|nr:MULTISPECIES: hypothetical protein [unclassified Caulobacter]PTS89073.1 hypothetical protein DBR21_07655 [Caulobacter sp. HMWF009]PTT05052.1 hypothetical protein DBR10_16780 [Caulobacter sp. HMWF025]
MPSLLLAALLLVQQGPVATPTEVAPVTVEAAAKPPAPPAPIADRAIEQQLNDLLEKEPGRVICLTKTPTGTRIAKPLCQTLRGWYDFEAARDTASLRGGAGGIQTPPYELVDLIKARMRDPTTRAMAEARAGARLEAEAQARADER